MKKILALLLVATLFSCKSTQHLKSVKKTIEKDRIAQEIEDIIKTSDPNVNIGISIVSLDTNELVFEKNQYRHYVPGSTIKLFTLAAALHYLGPYHRFQTTIFTDELIDKQGSVKNLYIQGSGDPSLMDTDVIRMVSELKQMGIKKITGNIYVDDFIFDDVNWGRGTMWDDRDQGYSAPVSGLNVNYNRLLIKTLPSRSTRKKAHSIVTPATSFVELLPNAITKSDNEQKQINVVVERGQQRTNYEEKDGLHLGDKIVIEGQTSKSSDPFYHKLAVSDPAIFVGTLLKDQCQQFGIKVSGKIERLATPSNALRLATHESRSLAETLIDFTKISNNLGSDALVKAIAAKAGKRPASSTEGFRLINDFITNEVGINANSLITADGSGLSRYNLVTPEQMVKLLNYASSRFHMGAEFVAALPIGGEDGLLRSRLTAAHTRGNVRAKTGTLSGVSCMAGYLYGVDGRRYAFALMTNGFIGSVSKYTQMHDKILSTMLHDSEERVARNK